MKETTKKNIKVFIGIGIFMITILIIISISIKKVIESTNRKLDQNILIIMRDSQVIKEQLGEVKEAHKIDYSSFEKYDKKGSLYTNYKIVYNNNEQSIIKIIVNPKFTPNIYAYEIDGELFYEDVNINNEIELRYFKDAN